MKLYKPLELPLLYETDETKRLEDAGIEVNNDMFVVRTSTLYQISSIGPQYHDSDKTSVVCSDGVTYSVAMPYKELKKLVDEAMM